MCVQLPENRNYSFLSKSKLVSNSVKFSINHGKLTLEIVKYAVVHLSCESYNQQLIVSLTLVSSVAMQM